LADLASLDAFIRKWRAVELKEDSAAQKHSFDLCRVVGQTSIYDLRTSNYSTLKKRPLRYACMAKFVTAVKLSDRGKRQETERFKRFTYAEVAAREKMDLNLYWLRKEGTDPTSLPAPAEIAASIAEELEGACLKFRSVSERMS